MVKLANLMLKIANSISSRSSKYANIFLNIARNMAEKDNAKMKIELPNGEGPITYRFEKANKNSSTAWDNYYANAGLFINGKLEEIKIDSKQLRKGSLELTDKARVQTVINAELGRSLWGFAQGGNKQEQLSYVIIAGMALIIFMMMM